MPRIGITCSPGQGNTQPIEKVGRLYVDGVVGAGGLPVVLPSLHRTRAFEVVDGLDGLLLTGGGDVDPACYGDAAAPECGPPDAARDAWELELVAAARAFELPILGICRGAQVLNVAFGGALLQDLPDRGIDGHDDERVSGDVHGVALTPGSLVSRVVDTTTLPTNTLHHQAIDPARIGSGLQVTGVADDGVVEAVEAADGSDDQVLGVQWHPELMLDRPAHQRLFDWLVDPDRFR